MEITQGLIETIIASEKKELEHTGIPYTEVKKVLIKLHPDICHQPKAEEAFKVLQNLKNLFETGKPFQDDAGDCLTNGYFVRFKGDPTFLEKSAENFKLIKSLNPKGFDLDQFHKYLPDDITFDKDTKEIVVEFDKKAVPLTNQHFEQVHVNWVLSRILEFNIRMNQLGYVHVGINPESVFVVPETHGIKVVSFYHVLPEGASMAGKNISGRYKNWYPTNMFSNKIATAEIVLELSKRIGVYLLGDQSGSGVKLKTTQDQKYLNLLQRNDIDPYLFYSDYRNYISANFKPEFITLSI